MIRSLKRALQPALTDVSLKVKVGSDFTVLQSPQNLPPIFNGEKCVSYAVLKTKKVSKKAISCTAILKGNMLGAKQEHKISFTLDSSAAAPSLPVIHHLAAKALITDWETENKEKKSIVDLSIESSVISSHTAFIAIDEESSEPVSGAMKTYDVQAESFCQKVCMSQNLCFGGRGGGPGGGIRSAGLKTKAARKSGSYGLMGHSDDSDDDMYYCMAGEELESSSIPQLNVRGAALDELCEGELEYELESWSEGEGQERVLKQRMEKKGKQKATNKVGTGLTNLITAQQVNGSWALTSSFAQLLGKSLLELETACPIEKKGDGATVWATILAVSLLRVKYSNQQDEWELIVMKAESWLKKQTLPPGSTVAKLFEAAQKYI